jgi:uncharacterized protein (TIGR03083 family)
VWAISNGAWQAEAMESERLRECLAADFARLRDIAATTELSRQVPSCPDWTLADLVQHVGAVYLHKVECMRLGTNPRPWPPEGLEAEDPRALLERGYAALDAEFASRAPESAAFTWYAPDQTVGFWIRRMAQETVIHRVDAELAAGVDLAPIPKDLALDGIDEFLVAFVEFGSRSWPEDYADVLPTADGRSVRLDAAGSSWLVRPTPEGVEVRVSDVDGASATVAGEPTDLLLWTWNRADNGAVTASGDLDLVADLRRIFVGAAQ